MHRCIKLHFNVTVIEICHKIGTTLPQCSWNVVFNAATMLPTEVGKAFIFNELTTSMQPFFN